MSTDLLRWAQSTLQQYGVKAVNLSKSWQNGQALCTLIYHYAPKRMVNFAQMDFSDENSEKNLTVALQIAHELGVKERFNPSAFLKGQQKMEFSLFMVGLQQVLETIRREEIHQQCAIEISLTNPEPLYQKREKYLRLSPTSGSTIFRSLKNSFNSSFESDSDSFESSVDNSDSSCIDFDTGTPSSPYVVSVRGDQHVVSNTIPSYTATRVFEDVVKDYSTSHDLEELPDPQEIITSLACEATSSPRMANDNNTSTATATTLQIENQPNKTQKKEEIISCGSLQINSSEIESPKSQQIKLPTHLQPKTQKLEHPQDLIVPQQTSETQLQVQLKYAEWNEQQSDVINTNHIQNPKWEIFESENNSACMQSNCTLSTSKSEPHNTNQLPEQQEKLIPELDFQLSVKNNTQEQDDFTQQHDSKNEHKQNIYPCSSDLQQTQGPQTLNSLVKPGLVNNSQVAFKKNWKLWMIIPFLIGFCVGCVYIVLECVGWRKRKKDKKM